MISLGLIGWVSLAVLSVSAVMLTARFCMGPTVPDRLAAFEALTLAFLSFVAMWSLLSGTVWFFDAILVVSLVGFLGTVFVARYLEKGRVHDD